MGPRPLAIVTGSGARRVGAAVAEALARRGDDLVVHYHHSAAAAAETVASLEAHGTNVVAVQADLADEAAVRRLVATAQERFGRIDALVNCAAIWERRALEETTAADVRAHFEVNTLGTFLCCQHAGLAMVGQPQGGSIVNVGDWADARPYTGYAAYFASKAGIPGLTRCFAVELGTRNPKVRVNCVLPGPVMLPPDMPEAERLQVIDATLVKREGRPDNVAQAVLAFLENDFVTGACLTVDGGRMVFAPD